MVIPTFNAASYIEQALESVAAQTVGDFDVVIVDDGSDDGTIEAAAAAVSRLGLPGRAVARPADVPKGVAGARNHGIRASAGTWVAFLDADDLFDPAKLERCRATIADRDIRAGALHHDAEYFDDATGASLGRSPVVPTDAPSFLDVLLARNCVTTSTTVVHRSCLEQLSGFDTRLNGVEDYWLWIRIAKRWPWHHIAAPLTRYRIREGSLMGRRPFEHYVAQFTALLAVAESSGELSASELSTLRHSVIDGPVRFYGGKSLDRGGIEEFLPGLLELARHGHPGRAMSIAYHHLRTRVLRRVLHSDR